MNNELNQLVQTNEQPQQLQPQVGQQQVQPQVGQQVQPQVAQQQVQPQVVQPQVQQEVSQQPLADVLVQPTTKPVENKVDFNSLSPLEKQQLIERAIKEAELKCKIEKPKGYNKLNSFIIGMILICIACVVILNILN